MGIMFEREIEKRFVKRIRNIKGYAWKFVSPGLNGVPDRIVLLGGRVYFVELKRPGGVLSPIQKVMINRIKRAGLEVFIIENDHDIDSVIRILESRTKNEA